MVGSSLFKHSPIEMSFRTEPREKFLIRVHIVENFTSISVDDSQSPHRILIEGLSNTACTSPGNSATEVDSGAPGAMAIVERQTGVRTAKSFCVQSFRCSLPAFPDDHGAQGEHDRN